MIHSFSWNESGGLTSSRSRIALSSQRLAASRARCRDVQCCHARLQAGNLRSRLVSAAPWLRAAEWTGLPGHRRLDSAPKPAVPTWLGAGVPPESKPPGLCVAWDSASPELCTTAGWSLQRHDSAPPPGHPGVGAADCAAWQHRLDSAPPGPGFLDSGSPPGLGSAWTRRRRLDSALRGIGGAWINIAGTRRRLSQHRWHSAFPGFQTAAWSLQVSGFLLLKKSRRWWLRHCRIYVAPTPARGAESRSCSYQAAAQNPGGAKSHCPSGVDSESGLAESSWHCENHGGAAPSPSRLGEGATIVDGRLFKAAPSQGGDAESRRCSYQAAAQNPGDFESQRCWLRSRRVPVVLTQAESTQRRHQEAVPSKGNAEFWLRRHRVHAAPTPSGVAESRRCSYQAAAQSPGGVKSQRCWLRPLSRRVKIAQRKSRWGAESRRLPRVPAILTQAAPSPRSAETSRRRRVTVLQRPARSLTRQRRRILAALGRRVQAAALPAPSQSAPLPRCQHLLIQASKKAA